MHKTRLTRHLPATGNIAKAMLATSHPGSIAESSCNSSTHPHACQLSDRVEDVALQIHFVCCSRKLAAPGQRQAVRHKAQGGRQHRRQERLQR